MWDMKHFSDQAPKGVCWILGREISFHTGSLFHWVKGSSGLLAKLKCGVLPLAIETGRFKNIDRELRFCRVCDKNIVESEYHHLLHCEPLSHIRDGYKVDLFDKKGTQMMLLLSACYWLNTSKSLVPFYKQWWMREVWCCTTGIGILYKIRHRHRIWKTHIYNSAWLNHTGECRLHFTFPHIHLYQNTQKQQNQLTKIQHPTP